MQFSLFESSEVLAKRNTLIELVRVSRKFIDVNQLNKFLGFSDVAGYFQCDKTYVNEVPEKQLDAMITLINRCITIPGYYKAIKLINAVNKEVKNTERFSFKGSYKACRRKVARMRINGCNRNLILMVPEDYNYEGGEESCILTNYVEDTLGYKLFIEN